MTYHIQRILSFVGIFIFPLISIACYEFEINIYGARLYIIFGILSVASFISYFISSFKFKNITKKCSIQQSMNVQKTKKHPKTIKNIKNKLGFDIDGVVFSETDYKVINYLLNQTYFKLFSKSEKENYINKIFLMYDFNNEVMNSHFKSMLKENYFLDQEIIKYNGELTILGAFFSGSFYLMAIFISYLFINIEYILSFIVNTNITNISNILIISGTTLASFDVFFKNEKLIYFDQKIMDSLSYYESSWIQSIKISMLIHPRSKYELLDVIIVPSIIITYFLYIFKYIDISSTHYISMLLFFNAYSNLSPITRDEESNFRAFYTAVLGLLLILTSSNPMEFFDQTNYYILSILVYHSALRILARTYREKSNKRKFSYIIYLFLATPYILIKSFLKTIPVIFLSLLHLFLKLCITLKPTSAVRLAGFILLMVGTINNIWF